jgi:hypothetical protein
MSIEKTVKLKANERADGKKKHAKRIASRTARHSLKKQLAEQTKRVDIAF